MTALNGGKVALGVRAKYTASLQQRVKNYISNITVTLNSKYKP